jgi:hypothetical protein
MFHRHSSGVRDRLGQVGPIASEGRKTLPARRRTDFPAVHLDPRVGFMVLRPGREPDYQAWLEPLPMEQTIQNQ